MTSATARAVDAGFAQGMFQHRREVEAFLAWVSARLGALRRVLEIGAHRGGTAAMFCELAPEQVVSVDLPDGEWGGVGEASAAERDRILRERYPQYTPIWGNSHDPATRGRVAARVSEVDLLFIDGDHAYRGVKADFEDYVGFVRAGGAVAFHDINDTALHRDRGVQVAAFWRELAVFHQYRFSIGEEWGGIGAILV